MPIVLPSITRSSTLPTTAIPAPVLPEMMLRPGSVPSPIDQSSIVGPSSANNRMPSTPLGSGSVPVMSVPIRLPITRPSFAEP